MATANNNTQIAELDFNNIKTSLTNFLKSQDTFKDYNFAGSGLSTLLDVLTYNTQYNAYYLNMVANEMFMDSALQRSSVVSHAKELGYIPKSAIAPYATVNINIQGLGGTAVNLPKFSTFLSEAVNGTHYNFVTMDSYTQPVVAGNATFSNVIIKQGIPATQTFTLDVTTNPKAFFDLPVANIDTTTLEVLVYENPLVDSFETFTRADNFLTIDSNSLVYFLQEGFGGNWQIYFGDGVLGKQVMDGSRIVVSYLVTEGTASIGANNFTATTSLGTSSVIIPVASTINGGDKETLDSIRYQATKSFGSQKRAITKEDYITAIQQNKLGFSFDAVSAWGGQENNPPVYGQVFISVKPSGSYALSNIQKQKLINEVIKPVSMMTVVPTIVDPDYTYIQITTNVYYDPKKTPLTNAQIGNLVKNSISSFAANTLNTFNSTFSMSDLVEKIAMTDKSIITNEAKIKVQKKFYPNLVTGSTYNLYYGTPLAKGLFQSGVTSFPAIQYKDPNNITNTIDNVQLEEVPSSTGGLQSVSVINTGFAYQSAPKVEIVGDGTGATAQAVVVAGKIISIEVLTPGSGYTSAIVKITPQANDTTGQLGAAVATLEGKYGTLRLYYYDAKGVKTVLKDNAGTIDYNQGLITLKSFSPVNVDNALGQLTVTANPTTSIISSSYNRIITVDPYDTNAIIVNVIAKT
jgi:hypothetical protein